MDWITYLSGAFTTLIGFLFAVRWDTYKFNRDSKARENAVLSAVRAELTANLSILQRDKMLLFDDLKAIQERKAIVAPLSLLQSGFWDLVKINLPQKLTEPNILIQIGKAGQLTEQINEEIRSRENYRINNGNMDNFITRLALYDKILLKSIEELKKLLEELQGVV